MENLRTLPVLLYHKINHFKQESCVSPARFEDHCRALAKAGWRGVSLAEAEGYLLHGQPLPAKSCLFTFDDGYADNYLVAEPVLRRYGHYGAFFPILKLLDKSGDLRPRPDTPPAGDGMRLPPGYCSWAEVKWMHHHGNLTAAPHSMLHDQVVQSLEFDRLLTPSRTADFYRTFRSNQDIPWGFPCFPLGPSLAVRHHEPSPELFALIRNMVPQERERADAFLAVEENIRAVVAAVRALPQLGAQESEAEYRARIGAEFLLCRETFRLQLGGEPISFCWPWGRDSPLALEEARKNGFRVFFTSRPGANPPGKADAVRRFVIYDDIQGAELVKILLEAVEAGKRISRVRADVPTIDYQARYEHFIRQNPEYAGLRRCCNVCGYRFGKFRLFNTREAQCPVCTSLERHRHMFIYLHALAPFLTGCRVLHFAPETGLQNFFRKFDLDYYDADINPEKAGHVVDITNMRFEDGFFDYVIANHVLNAIPDDLKAITELHRVLKPGGTALLTVGDGIGVTREYGDSAEEFVKRPEYRVGNPVRSYGSADFLRRLRKAGFTTQVADADHLPEDMREECLLTDRVVFARKKHRRKKH